LGEAGCRQVVGSWASHYKVSKVGGIALKEEPIALVLNGGDCKYASRILCLAAQAGVTFPDTTFNQLVTFREKDGLLVCEGRIQAFNEDKTVVPILPHERWISALMVQETHAVNHKGLAGTLLRMRSKAWVVQGKRVAKRVIDSNVTCRKARANLCRQLTSDLPPERTRPAAPFEITTMELFGPYEVRDEVKKRVRL